MSIPNQCDVAIIGAGIGGLTAATLLAKSGLDVCVFEHQGHCGGYLGGYRRQDFHFDTAIHWLNQCAPGGSVRRVFDFVAANSPKTPLQKRIRRYKGDSFDYLLTDNPDELRDTLIRDFPQDRDGLYAFFAIAKKLGQIFNKYSDMSRTTQTMPLGAGQLRALNMFITSLPLMKYMGQPSAKGLRKFFSSEELCKIFVASSSMVACLTTIGWAYIKDYQLPPQGGSQAFVQWLTQLLAAWDATIVCRCPVTQVLVDNKRAVGVCVQPQGQQAQQVRSKYVIGACDLTNLYTQLLPPGLIQAKFLQKLHNAELYESAFNVCLGLNTDPRNLGFDEEIIFLTCDQVPKNTPASDPNYAAVSIIAPSLRDPTLAPPGKGTLNIFVSADIEYADSWQTQPNRQRQAAYYAFKEQYAQVLIQRVATAIAPDLPNHIEVCDIATPITYWRYSQNRNGTIMGAKPSWSNIRASIAHYITPVKNLLLGGHWAEFGGGMPIAVRAGTNSALLILQRENPQAFAIIKDVVDGKIAPQNAQSAKLRTF